MDAKAERRKENARRDEVIESRKSSKAMARRDEVVRLRETGLTYAQIGLVCGIGKPRVRQILKSKSRRDEAVRLREAGLTYLEIGRKFGITKERVRQIIKGNPPRRPVPDRAKVMLRISDVAQLLGVHPNTARRWSDRGMLKQYRLTSRGDRRFKREDVDAFLRERLGTG